MYKTLLILTALALAQARPNDDAEVTNPPYEFHKDCPPAEVHFLIPHEYDCTKFYYCEYGFRFTEPINCAPGTEFNAEKQVCTHPWASNCTLPGFLTTSTDVVGITQGTTEGTPATEVTAATDATPEAPEAPSQEDNTPPAAVLGPPVPFSSRNADDCETLNNGCPVDFSIHKVIAHEEYCHLFYFCDKGERVLWACPEPLYFNPEAQVCVWSWQTDCVNNGSYTYPTTAGPEIITTPDIGAVLDNGCPADFDIPHLLPHEECEKYYQCNFGQKLEQDCQPGTVFNFEAQVCDWPSNVRGCEGSPGATARPPTTPEITTPNDPEDWVALPNGCPADSSIHHLLPHESKCDRYYVCDNGRLVEMGCPAGTHFSPTLQQCTWPHEAGCEHWTGGCGSTSDENGGSCGGSSTAAPSNTTTTEAPPCTNCTVDPGTTTVLPDSSEEITLPSDPELPGETTNGKTTAGPTGPICDTEGSTVDPGTTTAGLPDSSEEITLPSDPELPGESTAATTAAPGCPECPPLPVNPADRCKQGCNIAPWPHPECDKYYSCIGNEFRLNICSEGLHFNPSTLTCDFICNAGCVRNIPQITRHPDGLLTFVPNSFNNKKYMMEFIEHEFNGDL